MSEELGRNWAGETTRSTRVEGLLAETSWEVEPKQASKCPIAPMLSEPCEGFGLSSSGARASQAEGIASPRIHMFPLWYDETSSVV